MDVCGDWTDVVEVLEATSDAVLKGPRTETTLDELEGIRYLTRLVASGALLELESHSPEYPRFSRLVTPWRQWGLPNPDFDYMSAPIHGDYTYRVFGRRGTGRFLTVGVFSGRPARMNTVHHVDSAIHVNDGSGNLSVDPDGTFEIFLSRERRAGSWLKLPDGEGSVAARNAFYDWETEEPAMVFIEREGATYPAPPYDEEDLSYRIGRLVENVSERRQWFAVAVDQAYAAEPGTVQFPPLAVGGDHGAGDDQVYGQGVFHCGADEAVILEVTPPRCVYWNFHIATKNWESFDWDQRQTSINGHQAVLDSDGVFRAVISHQDPGVPNWLDASNHTTGLIAGRYRTTDSVPIPHFRSVPFAELRDHLPADTAVVGPEERSATLQRRRLAIVRRFYG